MYLPLLLPEIERGASDRDLLLLNKHVPIENENFVPFIAIVFHDSKDFI
jgi:hypothetical protein